MILVNLSSIAKIKINIQLSNNPGYEEMLNVASMSGDSREHTVNLKPSLSLSLSPSHTHTSHLVMNVVPVNINICIF